MEWTEDSSLATRMLRDLGEEIWLDKHLPHVTELIYCLTRSWYQRKKPLPFTPREVLLFATGVGLEQVLLKRHKQQIEGVLDGIGYATDFLTYEDYPGELKLTRYSAKKGPDELPSTWRRQILSYLKCNEDDRVLLAILHLMGDYGPPFPMLKAWQGKATQSEINWNWAWILERKKVYMASLETDTPPEQFTTNEDWECDNCGYKLICDANQAIKDMKEG
ncbi:hypothetical protein LCGC14_2022050 [marine sediment metagenome]|uniref:PD-(D/E)XK endonuclease-like domain-containing protein n=1 Tax=marine sediment metagenome TaxID=412755 RepID=A0A0F9HAH9_9ZZZZ